MATTQVDYYRILDVESTASESEIKRSYRRLAKKYHPDLHPDQREWALGQFKTISEAYQVLADPQRREAYDVRHRHFHKREPRRRPPGWPWEDEIQMAARTILNALLQENRDEALRLYEALKARSGLPDPLARLEARDYIDCKFLLGEAYESTGQLDTALDLFEEVFEEERDEPRLRCYFDVILDKLRRVYGSRLSGARDPDSAHYFYEKALSFETTNGNRAEVHKRMAEVLLGLGQPEDARPFLEKAFLANPKLKGVQRISSKLNLTIGVN